MLRPPRSYRLSVASEREWATIACLGVDYERVADAYIAGRPDVVLREALVREVRRQTAAPGGGASVDRPGVRRAIQEHT